MGKKWNLRCCAVQMLNEHQKRLYFLIRISFTIQKEIGTITTWRNVSKTERKYWLGRCVL